MLYTTYLSKIKQLPSDTKKIVIVRFLPKSFDLSKDVNIKYLPQLAPSQELLLRYKKDNNWSQYIIDFNNEIETRQDMIEKLQQVLKILKNGNDLYLICYEKDYEHCHRYLLAQWFEKQGIEWKEF